MLMKWLNKTNGFATRLVGGRVSNKEVLQGLCFAFGLIVVGKLTLSAVCMAVSAL